MKTFLWVMFVLALIGSNIAYVWQHETLHKDISEEFGCAKGKITWGIISSWKCQFYQDRTEANKILEQTLQNQVDIIGYPLHIIMNVIIIMVLIFTILVFAQEKQVIKYGNTYIIRYIIR